MSLYVLRSILLKLVQNHRQLLIPHYRSRCHSGPLKTTDRSSVMSALNLKLKFRRNPLDSLWAVEQWWGAMTSHLNHAPPIKQFVTHRCILYFYLSQTVLYFYRCMSYSWICHQEHVEARGQPVDIISLSLLCEYQDKACCQAWYTLPHSLGHLPSPVNAFLNVC